MDQRGNAVPARRQPLTGRTIARCCALVLGLTGLLVAPPAIHAEKPLVEYTPNTIMTTPWGPPAADIVVHPSNFVPCVGGPIALCYYSGPEEGPGGTDLSCVVTDDKDFANCRCIEIPHGPYFVDINAILDTDVYLATVKKCGKTGADCSGQPNKAPVCKAIQAKRLLDDASPPPDTISTFSYALNAIPEFAIGQTTCDPAPYAGCMTAPCVRTEDFVDICDVWGEVEVCGPVPIDVCTCPTFPGPYQVGANDATCDIGNGNPNDNIWSAAYNPAEGKISQVSCTPDAPGDTGCPLLSPVPGSDPLVPAIPDQLPQDISCGRVCAEYRNNKQDGIEVAFTCDATLCTASGVKDAELVTEACDGLADGRISETLRLEFEVGCSCCASQLCECEPSPKTNRKIFLLNEEQRLAGHPPQCDSNGSLCGEP
jgi:hypothetical protein